ncbi:hypothetical protein GBAR_LOCUS8625 [Geodia barretti]|uniref:Uncharacterized protein n=1 Tax=Geodia barretti TaxID=519541 RepID=A0AA35RMV5_GEOBA|nr:hypothetical protein GBAR_LOCUS8625 [Geodia barretti]
MCGHCVQGCGTCRKFVAALSVVGHLVYCPQMFGWAVPCELLAALAVGEEAAVEEEAVAEERGVPLPLEGEPRRRDDRWQLLWRCRPRTVHQKARRRCRDDDVMVMS